MVILKERLQQKLALEKGLKAVEAAPVQKEVLPTVRISSFVVLDDEDAVK